ASMVGLGTVPGGPLIGAWSQPPYATIGLGTGTMGSYTKPFQHLTYYEIDDHVRAFSLPGVRGIRHPLFDWGLPTYDEELAAAGRRRYFTYQYNALKRGGKTEVIMGDARLSMTHEQPREDGYYPKRDNYYHVIVVDAFSSDAIPVHLLTLEAVQLYMSKL